MNVAIPEVGEMCNGKKQDSRDGLFRIVKISRDIEPMDTRDWFRSLFVNHKSVPQFLTTVVWCTPDVTSDPKAFLESLVIAILWWNDGASG